jgi:hypothetical protein
MKIALPPSSPLVVRHAYSDIRIAPLIPSVAEEASRLDRSHAAYVFFRKYSARATALLCSVSWEL